ncbi:MAG: energy transducer TonB [Opitutaceae bacterium]
MRPESESRMVYCDARHKAVSRVSGVGAWILGIAVTTVLFLALPFFESISAYWHPVREVMTTELSLPPPPMIEEAEPPPPEEEDREEPPELQETLARLSLSQIEVALNPGTGGVYPGAFSMDFEVESIDELEVIFNLNEVDRIPRVKYQVAPAYPYKLKEAGFEGSVVISFVCDPRGRVVLAHVKSSPHVKLAESAVRALRQWRFEPGIKNGKTVSVQMEIPFNFAVVARKW